MFDFKEENATPINAIYKLKEFWGKNCKIELIKDKDHFTILKKVINDIFLI